MSKISKFLSGTFIAMLLLSFASGCQTQEPPVAITPFIPPTPGNSQQVSSISYQGVEGQDALSLLKKEHTVETKSFGEGIGEFVETIDGITPSQNEFWSFYIDGKIGQVGASTYITKTGETIEWKLEAITN